VSETARFSAGRRRGLAASLRVAIAGVALLGLPAVAAAASCTNGGLTRNIEVVYADPGQPVPCEVIYDKSAEGAGQHSLWRANSEAGYCEARAAAFIDRLRGAGWTCDGAPEAEERAPAQEERAPAAEDSAPEEMLGETG